MARSFGPAPHGPISPTGFPLIKRGTSGVSSGCARCAAGRSRGPHPGSPRRRLSESAGKPLSMGASHQRSREAPAWARRSAGKGSKIMAIARSQRNSSRSSHREYHAARSHPGSTQPSRSCLSSRSLCVLSVTTLTSRSAWMPDLARGGVQLIVPHLRTRHRGSKTVAPATLPTGMENRPTLCLVPELSAARRPV